MKAPRSKSPPAWGRNALGGLTALALLVAAWKLWPAPPGEPGIPLSTPPSPNPAPPPSPAAKSATRGDDPAALLNQPGTPPEQDLAILQDLIQRYLTAMQRRAGPPLGDDADLVRILTGRNALRLQLLSPDHPAISPEGRLLDRWGTPYHVHALSAQSFEFRSAGPDKRLFTQDDLALPKPRLGPPPYQPHQTR